MAVATVTATIVDTAGVIRGRFQWTLKGDGSGLFDAQGNLVLVPPAQMSTAVTGGQAPAI